MPAESSTRATDAAPLDCSRLAVAWGVGANWFATTLSCAATAGSVPRNWSAVKATSRESAAAAAAMARPSAARV
jgi:hypothetical protein